MWLLSNLGGGGRTEKGRRGDAMFGLKFCVLDMWDHDMFCLSCQETSNIKDR